MKGTLGFGLARTRAAIFSTAASTLILSACLSGGGSEDSQFVGAIESDVTITGSVGDGPAVNADVRVSDKNGEELATLKSDNSGSYTADVRVSGSRFPLTFEATGGTDIVTNAEPDFVMRSAVASKSPALTANINPFSTFIYQVASDMNGGVSAGNLQAAEKTVVSVLNSGLTTLKDSGPVDTPINTGNAAEMVKSSETLAEIVRRTRDALNAGGGDHSADDVIEALGSDLIDGVIEGNGGPSADARTAAIAIVTSAEVLLEAMSNELHVNGVNATQAMRNAIEQVVSGTASPSIDELKVTEEMLQQVSIGLSAAYAITGESRVADLMQIVSGMQPGMDATLAGSLLPGNYRSALGNAVEAVAEGDDTVVATVNEISRTDDVLVEAKNRAPTIAGKPPTTVKAGSRYDFTPVASDLDGDALTFSIKARPSWANFDTSTGRLSGTPQASDVGNYDGVTITVSDGELTASVGPFSIEVSADNRKPTISGKPARSVTAGSRYSFTPNASDPDGDKLTFSISGKPSWASFDSATGRLRGTPSAGDVGSYGNIVISVSDGQASASLAAFSVEVTAAQSATGSVTLSWTPPTENEDGSALTDLKGYRIYYGKDRVDYNNYISIDSTGVSSYVIDNLTPGTYEFVATAINTSDVESRYSNAVVTVLP